MGSLAALIGNGSRSSAGNLSTYGGLNSLYTSGNMVFAPLPTDYIVRLLTRTITGVACYVFVECLG